MIENHRPYRACHRCGLVHDLGASLGETSMAYVSWKCTRCNATFAKWIDNQKSANRTMALAVAALAFFIPAIWLPLLTIERMGIRHRTSLLQGTWDLIQEGNWFVGVIVLVFSILLPVAKLIGLIELSWWGVLKKHHQATLLKVVEFAGRWSMMDVLLLALLVMTVKIGELVSFHLGPAVVAFVMCVVLNMMASLSFDPHSIWDDQSSLRNMTSKLNSESTSASLATAGTKPVGIPAAVESKPGSEFSAQGSYVRFSKWWLLTAISLLVSVGLIAWTVASRGKSIEINFRDGYGIRPESMVLHRGIEVGSVTNVRLDPLSEGIVVTVQLSKEAATIATKGSQFWIERPQISTKGVTGLDTIVSGPYIAAGVGKGANQSFNRAIQPSKSTSPQFEFVGLESPPSRDSDEGSIEIMLESSDRFGLQNDAPVVYRGVEVGRIVSLGLSRDGRWFQARASIDSKYRELIRENSVFWNRSGLRVDIGLGGVAVDAESVSAMAAGGIEFATPNEPGPIVKTGKRFEMFREPEQEWTQWRPRLIHGITNSSMASGYPTPYRLSLRWRESFYGFGQNKELNGWVLLLDDGTVLGPQNILTAPEKTTPGSVHWEIAGLQLAPESFSIAEATSRVSIAKLPNELDRWSIARVNGLLPKINPQATKKEPQELVIVDGPPGVPIPIEPFQLEHSDSSERTTLSTMGLTESHHGLPVLDLQSGIIVGLIDYDRETNEVSVRWIR